jgi:hypothetical protein
MSSSQLPKYVLEEIDRIHQTHGYDLGVLKDFAKFIRAKKRSPGAASKKTKGPTLAELKKAVYGYFKVKGTPQLKKSGEFKMATDSWHNLNLGRKEAWERLYREFVGIIPGEEHEEGYGCINGVNIFKYFHVWKVFGLDPQQTTSDEIKAAYRRLSKQYHPDNPQTGDAKIFDRLHNMYESVMAEA